ncbi:DUF2141 domain-containing protein [Pyruvatibacter mobilis]|uniref:DUF2141 domain-containing protein n=1 Tax=Pyruvatibacter mobilis TaxID=1712261 RepID=UPI003BAC6D0E
MPSPSFPAMLAGVTISAVIIGTGAFLAASIEAAPIAATSPVTDTPDLRPALMAEAAPPTGGQAVTPLTVTIEGVRSAQGTIQVGVFDDAAAYAAGDLDRLVDGAVLPARKGTVTHSFAGLTGGPYAIALFHDEDGNGTLTLSGDIPLEGYGTSGAKGPYDEPAFGDASVMAGPVRVQMHYLQ